MICKKTNEGHISFVKWSSLDEEIAGIAEIVRARHNTKFLIMVPRQFIGYRLKVAIGEDAVTTFREEILETQLVRERFAFACLLANENDPVSLRAWLSFSATDSSIAPHRNVDAYKSAAASGLNGYELLCAISDGSLTLAGNGKTNIFNRARRYIEDKAAIPAELELVVRRIFDPKLADALPGRPPQANENAIERRKREKLEQQNRDKARGDLDLLQRSALAIISETNEPTLEKIIDILRYKISTRAPLLDEDFEPRVRIMTLHGAKGLEEDSVIVCGLAQEIIPGPARPDMASHMREQRRLLYVAATRAKDELILSWASTIATADTHNNGIIAQPQRSQRGLSILAKSNLLPHRPDAPEQGTAWKASHLQSHTPDINS